MRQMGVLEARTNFSALVEEVENGGDPVTITRHGRPVAKLVSVSTDAGRSPGRISGAELLARLHASGEQFEHAAAEVAAMSWEELKAIARS